MTESLSQAKHEPIRILHVDDEAAFFLVTRRSLEIEGNFQIDTALSVDKALKKLKEKKFDVLVSDYQMPGKDGLEFLKELRAKGDNTPFIMFTGRGREEVAIQALNLGADQYINKIGDPETVYSELAHSIKAVVATNRLKEDLQESQESFKQLFMGNPEPTVYTDSNFDILDINSRFTKLFGYSLNEVKGKNINDVVVPQDRMEEAKILDRKIQKEYASHDAVRKKKDGTLVDVSIAVAPLIVKGKLKGYVGVYKDITERKKAEEELASSEGFLNSVIKQSPTSLWISDSEGTLVKQNQACHELFGATDEEAVGKYNIFKDNIIKSFNMINILSIKIVEIKN